MKNREYYITKKNEYDLMKTIYFNKHKYCPIEIIGAEKPKCIPSIYGLAQTDCEKCIQNWLNEEKKSR